MDEVKRLALDISSCDEVSMALKDESHPCHDVVKWQADQWHSPVLQIVNSAMHRPEAWTGDLSSAPIVFLASNPSFNLEENYPDWSENWNEEKISEFATRRFIEEGERAFGAIDSGPNRDRTILRNGRPSADSVAYWREIRGRVGEILGKQVHEVSAHDDFVMTELVHCKSHKEIGVNEALIPCTKKFIERIFRISPASIIIVMGAKPAQQFVKLYPEIPSDWGFWIDKHSNTQRGYWPKKIEIESSIANGLWSPEQQLKHTVELEIGGRVRKVIWLPRPNSSMPRTLVEPLISQKVMNYWRSSL
jgi:hypothetical protein